MTLHGDRLFSDFAVALLDPSIDALAGSTASSITLDVEGKLATIERDDFGVPHIFAPTNRSLFVAYGYAVAQDRLWQLELNRRAPPRGLAELLWAATPPAHPPAPPRRHPHPQPAP